MVFYINLTGFDEDYLILEAHDGWKTCTRDVESINKLFSNHFFMIHHHKPVF